MLLNCQVFPDAYNRVHRNVPEGIADSPCKLPVYVATHLYLHCLESLRLWLHTSNAYTNPMMLKFSASIRKPLSITENPLPA